MVAHLSPLFVLISYPTHPHLPPLSFPLYVYPTRVKQSTQIDTTTTICATTNRYDITTATTTTTATMISYMFRGDIKINSVYKANNTT